MSVVLVPDASVSWGRVAPEAVAALLEAMRQHPLGRDAARIGDVVAGPSGRVTVRTTFGTRRVVPMPVAGGGAALEDLLIGANPDPAGRSVRTASTFTAWVQSESSSSRASSWVRFRRCLRLKQMSEENRSP